MTTTTTRSRSTSGTGRRRPAAADPVTTYARAVVEGRIVAGWVVVLACKRHLRDLRDGPERGLTWDLAAALEAIAFFREILRLNGGDFEGQPFILSAWEAFIVGSLFGWKGADGDRRFRLAYIETAKGNGKSPLVAGIGIKCLIADGEARAEVYAAATKKDQAMILFRDAVAMVDQSPSLNRLLKRSGGPGQVWNLAHIESGSFFRPISSDDSQSGPRPHCALIDEVHEHKDSTIVDQMRAGTKGRRQALIVEITNSGMDQLSICYQHHEYSIAVLQAEKPTDAGWNDAWFAYVCTLDPCPKCRAEGRTQPNDGCEQCDNWRDPATRPKANPNLGVSIQPKYLDELVREAEGMPAKQNLVKRLNFCFWVRDAERAIPMDLWDQGGAAINLAALRGRRCYGGIDLAQVDDLSAFDLLFPDFPDVGLWTVLAWFWVPKDNIIARSRAGVPYDVWEREGLLFTTPGNTTDYPFIQRHILEQAKLYQIQELAYDRTFANEIVQNLQAEGLTMAEFGQGFLSMAAPTAELLRRVKAGTLRHGGNPILRWNASNLVVRLDPAGNMKPDKERSPEKIDGFTALCNAAGRAMVAPVGGGWVPL